MSLRLKWIKNDREMYPKPLRGEMGKEEMDKEFTPSWAVH
jgi:hypothetical protein